MSSKLLGADTVTQAVPWRTGFREDIHEPQPFRFDGLEPPRPAVTELPSIEAEPHAEPSTSPIPDHSACEVRIQFLEREVQRLEVQVLEEKRVAYQQGLEAGAGREMSKWNDALSRLAKSMTDLAAYKPRVRCEVEEDAVRLSLAIAKKILRREVNTDPGAIAGLLRVALEKTSLREVLRVRVSPQDAADLASRIGEFGLPPQVEVVADSGLERGALLLDSTQGHVDASIDTQLLEIERGLADALDRGRRK